MKITHRVLVGILFVSLNTIIMANDKITKSIGDISRITLKCNGIMHISQGDKSTLQIDANKTTLQNLIVREEGKNLYLEMTDDEDDNLSFWSIFTGSSRPEFYLTVKELEKIEDCSSGRIVFKTPIKTKQIELIISGNGDVLVDDITANDIDYRIHGSGNFKCKNIKSKNSFKIEINGSGDVTVDSLLANQTDISISGSGNIKINNVKVKATNSKISGNGTISLSGSCNDQNICVSGSGEYRANDFQSNSTDINASGSANIKVKVSKSINIIVHKFKHGRIIIYGSPGTRNINGNSSNIKFHN